MSNKITTALYKKGVALSTVVALSLSILTGCAGSNAAAANTPAPAETAASTETSAESNKEATTAPSGEVKKVKFGSGAINYPICFLDDDGNLAGFEYDLIKEVDAILPEYEFELTSSDWEDLVSSVKLGKLDLISWQIKRTPEREEEFLFADVPEFELIYYLIVHKTNDRIHSVADLQDDTVNGSGPSEYTYRMWTKYIEAHPEQNINLIASENFYDEAGITALENQSTAAVFGDRINAAIVNENLGGNVLKIVGDPIESVGCYYMYNKNNTELKEAVDKALQELKDNGTYDEIFNKWYGDADVDALIEK